MDIDRRDALLMELLNDTTTIVDFLDSIFGFLARRTDFYHVMVNEGDTLGFPTGFKEQLVFNALKKYDKISNIIKGDMVFEETPPVGEQIEVESSDDITTFVQENPKERITELERTIVQTKLHPEGERIPKEYPEGERIPEEHPNMEPIFQSNEYYNGAAYENYCWGQSMSDVEIHVLLPQEITSPKLLCVKIESSFISIKQKQNCDDVPILEGKLSRKCKYSDAVWSLTGGRLQISIDKTQEIWWERLFENEPALDLSKMDCSRAIEELPEESQLVIEKLHWDQQQKALGLPTSDDIRNQEILREAWDAEGSPFLGKPFDPSVVTFN